MAEELNPFNTPLKSRVPFGHQKMIITNKDRHLASGNCQSKSFFFFYQKPFFKIETNDSENACTKYRCTLLRPRSYEPDTLIYS